jgi:phosphoglycerate kinase
MSMQFIGDVPRDELEGKTVLLRVDYNVPLKKEDSVLVVADAARIQDSLPTLRFLLSNGTKVILISHLGRPKGQPKPECSLLPVVQYLHDRFLPDSNIMFVTNCSEEDVQAKMNQLGNGEILALENLRFHAEEEADDTSFAQKLARGVDIYVNDAFSACHRGKFMVIFPALFTKVLRSIFHSSCLHSRCGESCPTKVCWICIEERS